MKHRHREKKNEGKTIYLNGVVEKRPRGLDQGRS